jgi:hypothetical protein
MPLYKRGGRALHLLVVAGLVLLFVSSNAFAWDAKTHSVIASLAELRLGAQAKTEITKLLELEGTADLKSIASWADRIRDSNRSDLPRHTARLSMESDQFQNCGRSTPCATDAIVIYRKVLENPRAKPLEKLEALKFLVHLIADIHQPLHATVDSGSKKIIFVNGKRTNLHRLWDHYVIPMSATKLVETLRPFVLESKDTSDDPKQWAIESRNIAYTIIYPDLQTRQPGFVFDRKYIEDNSTVAYKRIVLAAVRLSNCLNAGFSMH